MDSYSLFKLSLLSSAVGFIAVGLAESAIHLGTAKMQIAGDTHMAFCQGLVQAFVHVLNRPVFQFPYELP